MELLLDLEKPKNPRARELYYASILVERSIDKALDYSIPKHLENSIQKGMIVEVPLRGKKTRGYVLEIKDSSQVAKTLPVQAVVSTSSVLTPDLFELACWMAKYYICPLGKVIKTMLPAGVRKNIQAKSQYFVVRLKSRDELANLCSELRQRAPKQAEVLDAILKVKGGILLSKLLQLSTADMSSVKALCQKGFLAMEPIRSDPSFLVGEEYFKTNPKPLREEQQVVVDKISLSLQKNSFETHLLFGITGSGKTEVYLHAIEAALKLGKSVLMLVPEIALTKQTIEQFKSRFDEEIAVLHHQISHGEKQEYWKKMQAGTCKIVIGARSAIFSPLQNLGLLIVDEEHEPSYKQQDDSPRYQARDVAVMRGKISQATVVLGSATPSLESYYNAQTNKYILNTLTQRASGNPLPEVHIVDMKREWEKAKNKTPFSDLLLSNIEKRIKGAEQVILFLNRRGFHTLLTCEECGQALSCPHCSTKLTFHKNEHYVACHLCGYESIPPKTCPSCRSQSLMKYKGIGTEKIEASLKAIFPEIRTLRIDRDTTRHKGSLDILLHQFRSGKANVLIGTQMVAKGLHFPQVTLVGIIGCDGSINVPDFRAQESVFQQITQVAGRAGRGTVPGVVIIQTAIPDNNTILHASKQDYETFYKEEIESRMLFSFPPVSHLVKFLFMGKEENKVAHTATSYSKFLSEKLPSSFTSFSAVPAGHAKIKDHFRFQFLVRGPNVSTIRQAISELELSFAIPSSVVLYIDVDPCSTFF